MAAATAEPVSKPSAGKAGSGALGAAITGTVNAIIALPLLISFASIIFQVGRLPLLLPLVQLPPPLQLPVLAHGQPASAPPPLPRARGCHLLAQ